MQEVRAFRGVCVCITSFGTKGMKPAQMRKAREASQPLSMVLWQRLRQAEGRER